MKTYIYIPTINIKNDFDAKKHIDGASYINMLNANYNESSNDIDAYMNNGYKANRNYSYYQKVNYNNDKNYYSYNKVESNISDINDNNIDKNEILLYYNKQDMFVLILNINPDTLDEDSESEIKFWIRDSMKINNDQTMDDDLKIISLPNRNLKIEIDNKIFVLNKCRILDNYSDIKIGKIKFAILVEKITL